MAEGHVIYPMRWITVSVDFKIEEALLGLRRCEALADRCEWGSPEQDEHKKYAEQWRNIAISWASR